MLPFALTRKARNVMSMPTDAISMFGRESLDFIISLYSTVNTDAAMINSCNIESNGCNEPLFGGARHTFRERAMM